MIADLKPYAEYKESDLPWIGTMPAHWDARRLRHACEMRVSNIDKHTKKGENPVRLCNYVDVYKNERIKESLHFMSASATKDELMRFRLRQMDVVVTKDSEDWKDIGVPSLVEYEAPDLVCGYHLAMIRPRMALIGAFLHRVLQCHYIAAQLRIEANGVTRYGLSHGAILGVSIPLPSPEEQAAIVRFLDWANGRLDRAIRAKRKVIALLNEQKQAIIHRAVTRGLDPSVPLRPSGVPWLADVPAHWTVMPLKHAFTSMDYGISDPTFDAGRIRVLGMGQIKDGEITVPEDGGVNTVDPSLFLKDGDLLFNRTNSAALVGKVGIFRGHNTPVTFASYLVRLRPKSGFDSEYLNFVLNSSVILNVARQSSIPSLHQSNLNPARYGRLAIAALRQNLWVRRGVEVDMEAASPRLVR
ncbi:MAG: hypothetical protein ACP5E2_15890, partial [Terracidiphilus sp.]